MARPSTFQPRPSLWAGGQTLLKPDAEECSPYLLSCVQAMSAACRHTRNAQISFRRGVSDLPRMSKVLDNERLFAVVNESIVRQYANQLQEEVEPQVTELLSLAEQGLQSLEREHSKLQAKVEASTSAIPVSASAASKMEMRRLNMLTAQREKLKLEIAELETIVSQLEMENFDHDDYT